MSRLSIHKLKEFKCRGERFAMPQSSVVELVSARTATVMETFGNPGDGTSQTVSPLASFCWITVGAAAVFITP